MRYAEEVELLLEEMRRVLVFLEWDRDRWKNRAFHIRQVDAATHPSTPSPSWEKAAAFEEGLRAYALRQASVRQRLFDAFSQQWHDVPAFLAFTDWGFTDEEEEAVVDDTI